jgi:phosphoribosyl-AMP cyclohydrolase
MIFQIFLKTLRKDNNMVKNAYKILGSENFYPSDIKFNKDGLVPVIAQCIHTRAVLMMAWMNDEAVKKTINTNNMYYFSRSRQKLWQKGETSGHFQKLVELRLDCDNDTMLALIEQTGSACHTGAKSCFFKSINDTYND